MASQNSTGFDPKSLSHDEQMEYNENLYKKLLPTFKRHITVDIMHTTVISEKLQTSEMEKVEKKRDNEGDQAAAAYLLQILYKKSDWFNCLITAMEDESNKLTDLIPPFLKLKGEVDEDWLKKHRRPTKSSSPESRSHTDGIFSPSGIPQSDFELKGADGYGMHRDGNCEDSTGSTVTAAGSSQVPLLSRDADNSSADTYIDARSTKPKSASSIPGGESNWGSGSVDMISLHHNHRRAYSEMLRNNLLPEFKKRITPTDFIDIPIISSKLTTGEKQKVEQKEARDGQQAAAVCLLHILERKADWFSVIIKAMEEEECKLSEFIPSFMKIKEEVDREWLAKHPETMSCSLPEFRPRAPVNLTSPGLRGTFNLELPGGVQKETTEPPNQGPTTTRMTSQESNPAPDADESLGETYIDASSTELKTDRVSSCLQRLQIDAVLEAQQESVAPPVTRQEFFQSRQDHPGLRYSLSSNPAKDFEGDFVRKELRDFPAFSSDEEEQKIIQQLRPHLCQPGSYIIWFWALAKRPTICVVTEGRRFLTFVVHKSSEKPPSYFIHKRFKTSQSLKEIVQYHIYNGIYYTCENGTAVNVPLQTHITKN